MVYRIITWLILIFALILGVVTVGLFVLNIDTPVPANWGSEAGVKPGITDWLNILFLSIVNPSISTFLGALIIAGQFSHLMGWLQRYIDRRSNRRKSNIEQALRNFSVSLRQEVDVIVLGDRLLAFVEETIKPSDLSLWISPVRVFSLLANED